MPAIEPKFEVSLGGHEVSPAADPDAEIFARLGLADVPRPPLPEQIMAHYRRPETLPSFDSEIVNGSRIERKYGTSVVVGDAHTQLMYAAIRREMVKAGPQNRKVLARVEHNTRTIRIRPYRLSERPTKTPETDRWRGDNEQVRVRFGLDQGELDGRGGRHPPVVTAAHELAHAAEFDDHLRIGTIPMGRYSNLREYLVITGPEEEIQKYYGGEARDSHVGGVFYQTKTTKPDEGLTPDTAAQASVTAKRAANDFIERRLVEDAGDLKAAGAKLQEYPVDMTNPPEPEEVDGVEDITSAAQALGFRDRLFKEWE